MLLLLRAILLITLDFNKSHFISALSLQALREDTPVATGGTLFSARTPGLFSANLHLSQRRGTWHLHLRFYQPPHWQSLVKLPG